MAELDLEKVLLNLVKPMVEDPDSVSVKSLPSLNENEILLVVYAKSEDMPKVLNGLGIAIVSTSKGIMTDKQARRENLGGEVLAYVW